MRKHMAEFTVDGVRFGELLPETKSGSVHDRRLTKRSEEIVTAAFIFGRLGYQRVQIFTRDTDGKDLERSDLDVRFETGEIIGVEVAQVSPTSRMKHDANIAVLEHTIRDLIETDSGFADAFGPYYLSVSQSGPLGDREVANKKIGERMVEEVVAFVRAQAHRTSDESGDEPNGWFGPEYPTLNGRSATYYVHPAAYGPYFSVMDGGTVNPKPETEEVIRVLDQHRRQAASYRRRRNWILLYLPDTNEVFRNTVEAVSRLNPDIAPFEQCHVTDSVWRLASLS
ncbi:MAG TPA: hypothetical protein VJP85_13830 [Candidatus Baltobacteraceae bacterium]|nr:hypothetical protein [Candidatus Baltobacteraceae bacterium]